MQSGNRDLKNGRYLAFVTSAEAGSQRIPIDGERIVILLGTDSEGRPLDLSLELTWTTKPGKLLIAAIKEPIPEDSDELRYPHLRVESPTMVLVDGKMTPVDNVGEVWIEYS